MYHMFIFFYTVDNFFLGDGTLIYLSHLNKTNPKHLLNITGFIRRIIITRYNFFLWFSNPYNGPYFFFYFYKILRLTYKT